MLLEQPIQIELKSTLTDLIKILSNIIKIHIPSNLVSDTIRKFYDKGLQEQEIKLEMNFRRNPTQITALESYTFDNIKGMTDEIAEKLRKEIMLSHFQNESLAKMQKRVQEVMKVGVNRAKMIARTEGNRAMNMGRLDAAKQSGVPSKKWLLITYDSRTSNISKAMGAKYGSPEQAIPLNKNFRAEVNGKVFEGPAPPFHPNERDRLMVEVTA